MKKHLEFNNFDAFRNLLTYPRFEQEVYKARLNELDDIGVKFNSPWWNH